MHITEIGHHCGFVVRGFTKCKINHGKEKHIIKNPRIGDEECDNFCMVNFEDNMYPACIHGFFQMRSSNVPTRS